MLAVASVGVEKLFLRVFTNEIRSQVAPTTAEPAGGRGAVGISARGVDCHIAGRIRTVVPAREVVEVGVDPTVAGGCQLEDVTVPGGWRDAPLRVAPGLSSTHDGRRGKYSRANADSTILIGERGANVSARGVGSNPRAEFHSGFPPLQNV